MTPPRLSVLVLYDAHSTYTQTVIEHLRSFPAFSRHRIFFAHATGGVKPAMGLEMFDAVVLHYSVRLAFSWLSSSFVEALAAFRGAKLLFIQDEYDYTETARGWMERLGLSVVFTCVPKPHVERVYPPDRFRNTEFITTLTGFVPPRFEEGGPRRPIAGRPIGVGYRGRALPFWYGRLGREKLVIGQQMKRICAERAIPADIEWTEESRIYGEGWYEFLGSCKATLGAESGSNVFDERGEIRDEVKARLARDPGLSYEEAFERDFGSHEGAVAVMNQISPKVFEAIALGTALVLYEGAYSEVVAPNVHYIPLAKDLSNIEDVVAALKDDARLQQMADRAHADVIASGRWSYRQAIKSFDEIVDRHVQGPVAREPFAVVMGVQGAGGGSATVGRFAMSHRLRNAMTTAPLFGPQLAANVGYVPAWLRAARSVWNSLRLGSLLQTLRGNR